MSMSSLPGPAVVDCIEVKRGKKRKNLEDDGRKKVVEEMDLIADFMKFNSEYYFENGLRKVYPYHYDYHTSCKRRWIGLKVVDVVKDEFRSIPEFLIKKRFDSGCIRVNGNVVGEDYIFKDNDILISSIHRHETPVLAAPIKIVEETEDLLVIDKPPSLPVHPCGTFRFNTVLGIMAAENHYKEVRICHRLDRLTSGLLIMAKTSQGAHRITRQIQDKNVIKKYVCKVEGEFPEEAVCEMPIDRLSFKIGTFWVNESGKASKTLFKRLASNGKESVVECTPLTGRTHQIRVHLQYLGYPILNDPLYNSTAFGPLKGKGCDYGGKTQDELVQDILSEHPLINWMEESIAGNLHKLGIKNTENFEEVEDIKRYLSDEDWQEHMKKHPFDESKVGKDDICHQCKCMFNDPKSRHLLIYLHCLVYEGPNWRYSTKMPPWATLDEYVPNESTTKES